MKIEDLRYSDNGVACDGVLVSDSELSGKRPGVLVVHEAWGLGEHAIERAKMVARLGYVALAVDMFGNRRQVKDMSEAAELIGDLKANPAKIRARIESAHRALIALSCVDARRVGAIGFCFGGTAVLELARSGSDVAGVICFHGALDTPAPASKGDIKASILVCVGADDPMIPTQQVDSFQKEMRGAGADWQIVTYGSTVHSFTNPAADGSIAPVVLYNERSDHRSWGVARLHLQEVFAR